MTKTALSMFFLSLIATTGPGTKKVPPIQESREQSCRNCHSFTPGLSHAIDKPVKLDAELPLRRGQKIGCLTCHEDQPGHGLPGSKARVQLRRPGRKLCESCHQPRIGPSKTTDHALFLNRAHLTARSPGADSLRLDSETRSCLQCHDGSAARAGSHGRGSGKGRMKPEHPIGLKYDRSQRKSSNLRPRAELPTAIRLPGGVVGCGSCHSVYSGEPKKLVLPMQKSELCLACHDL